MSECFLSPSLVSVLCSSRGAELTMKGIALCCNLICQEEFILCCYNLLFFLFLFSLYLSLRLVSSWCLSCGLVLLLLFISSCLAAAPSQNSKAFLKCRASLSIEPVSPSKPCWKLCCSVLLFLGGGRGGLSFHDTAVCMCVCVCV